SEYPIRRYCLHGEQGEQNMRKVPLVKDNNKLANRAHMMPFKHILAIEHPNDDEPLNPTTNIMSQMRGEV
ncbi:MAG: hypothetical protein ACKPKO_24895, partial [Candidatus Fonsibacter sp.]